MDNLSYNQKSRIFRGKKENLFILDKKYKEGKIIFQICGATGNVYTIEIIDKNIDCNCIDSQTKCKKELIFCKHICFLYLKVLEITNNYLFINKKLSLEDVDIIYSENNFPESVIDEELSNNYNEIKNIKNKPSKKRKRVTFDIEIIDMDENNPEICLVCSSEISNKDQLSTCGNCNTIFHKKCIKAWVIRNKNCISCESDCWDKIFKSDTMIPKKYDNIY